jgi:hypothetical protein
VIPRVRGGYKGNWVDSMNFIFKLPSKQYIQKRSRGRGKSNDEFQNRLNAMLSGSHSPVPGSNGHTSGSSSGSAGGGGGGAGHGFSFPTTYGKSPRNSETESVASDLSRSSRLSVRASITHFFSGQQEEAVNDFQLTPDMFIYRPQDSLDWQDIVILKHYSIEKPDVLMGWQITRTGGMFGGTANGK